MFIPCPPCSVAGGARLYNRTMHTERITILLADDHAIVRAGIRQFLDADPGLQVVAEAVDGTEACRLIRELAPALAVLDIQMPGMNGIEVTRWLRREGLATRVLILSAFDDIPYVQAALKAGADGYEVKTAAPQEIIQAVYHVVAGEAAISSTIQQTLENRQQLPGDLKRALLSTRELEVLALAGEGLTNRQIAAKLSLSERTVQNHIASILQQLHASSRTEAVTRAISLGLILHPGVKGGL